jgi:serine/threonine protein phosphatase PrpC
VKEPYQDRVAVLAPHPTILVLALFGGSGTGGNIAAQACVDALTRLAESLADEPEHQGKMTHTWRRKCVAAMRDEMKKKAGDNASLIKMASTQVLLVVRGTRYWLYNMGDSRAYWWDGRVFGQMSKDHVKRGQEGEVLTHYVSPDPDVAQLQPYYVQGEALRPGIWLLCTHGLIGPGKNRRPSEQAINDILIFSKDPQQAANALIEEARAAGSDGDVSVIVADTRQS